MTIDYAAGPPVQGFTRYDAMIRLTRPIRYTHLRSCGHQTFVGAPLPEDVVVLGGPQVTLWVESSDSDADVFVYLEDEDPVTGKARRAALLSVWQSIIVQWGHVHWGRSSWLLWQDSAGVCTF